MTTGHHVPRRVCACGHDGQKRRILHGLDLEIDTHAAQVILDQREDVHLRWAAGTNLYVEIESIGIPGFSKEATCFLRIVGEQLLHRCAHFFQRLKILSVARVLRVAHQLRMPVVKKLDHFRMVDGKVKGAPDPHIVKRWAIHSKHHEITRRG